MSDKTPIWADETGSVICYMCYTDFQHDLGNDRQGVRAFPSVEAITKAKHCVESCGIVKVAVRQIDAAKEETKHGHMGHIEFFCELGGAMMGNLIFPTKQDCFVNCPYAVKYGVVEVEVEHLETVQKPLPMEEQIKLAKRIQNEEVVEHMVYPTNLAIELADRLEAQIHKWQETFDKTTVDGPDSFQPPNVLRMLERIRKRGLDDQHPWPDSKLHRLIGRAQIIMVITGIMSMEMMYEMEREAKRMFPEKPDEELIAHHDKKDHHQIDIGGES